MINKFPIKFKKYLFIRGNYLGEKLRNSQVTINLKYKFNDINFQNYRKTFFNSIKDFGLIINSSESTTFLESMSLNKPTISYLDDDCDAHRADAGVQASHHSAFQVQGLPDRLHVGVPDANCAVLAAGQKAVFPPINGGDGVFATATVGPQDGRFDLISLEAVQGAIFAAEHKLVSAEPHAQERLYFPLLANDPAFGHQRFPGNRKELDKLYPTHDEGLSVRRKLTRQDL